MKNLVLKNKIVWITGASGMVGSSLIKKIKKLNCKILKPNRIELNLLDSKKLINMLKKIDQT